MGAAIQRVAGRSLAETSFSPDAGLSRLLAAPKPRESIYASGASGSDWGGLGDG